MTKRGKGSSRRLTAKQRKFVLAFAASGNATQAAREAGYKGTDGTLRAVGCENLTKPDVAAAIAELAAKADATKIADRNERQEWLTRVVRGEVEEGNGPAKLRDRLKAAELLSRMSGEFVEHRKHGLDEGAGTTLVDVLTGLAAKRLGATAGAGVAAAGAINDHGGGSVDPDRA